ncbi:MAG: HEAT repeat domain-containing protein [Thermoguttaceae bacterium]
MDDAHAKRILARSLCALTVMLAGCAETNFLPSWVPFQGEPPSSVPGIATPKQRIEQIREMGKEANGATAERKREIVTQLSTSIRSEEDSMIREECVRALGNCFDAGAKGVLHAALDDPDAGVRTAACEAWGNRTDAEAAAILSGALSGDIDLDVRLAAARALGKSKDPAAVTALGEALEDRDPAMQNRAMLSLAKVTGKDFGGDAKRWRQYVRGELPEAQRPVSVVERLGGMFYD